MLHTRYSEALPAERERAVAALERRSSTFGELTLTKFDDPLLAEHTVYLAAVDIPKHI